MVQIFFASVIFNIGLGVVFARPFLIERFPMFRWLQDFRFPDVSPHFLGIATFSLGFLQLFIPYGSENLPVLGDLIPATSLFLLGFLLLTRGGSTVRDWLFRYRFFLWLHDILSKYSLLVGLLAIGFGVLHFFFANTLFF